MIIFLKSVELNKHLLSPHYVLGPNLNSLFTIMAIKTIIDSLRVTI